MPDHMVTLAWHTRPHKIRSQIHELTCEACHVHNRRGFGANDGIFLGMDLWSISPLYITFRFDTFLRAHLDQVPLNYPSETVVQPSSTAHFHYGFPTVEPLSRYSNKLLSSNLKTAIFQPCKRCHTP